MSSLILKMYNTIIKKPVRNIKLIANQINSKRECYICHRRFNHFNKYQGGIKNVPLWLRKLEIVGSDPDNFKCPFCGSTDRERHLYMYFDKLNLWENLRDKSVLHFAPEIQLRKKIEQYAPAKYIKADLYPSDSTIQKMDTTNIPFNNESFDIVICNHVLEHIPDHMKALKEIFRILKPNGIAILQTPFSKLLKKNIEDEAINTDELRLIFYGQTDHVRVFSEPQFIQSLVTAGFIVDVKKHQDFFNDDESYSFGVNKIEDLIKVTKPAIHN
ncbi:MAG: class I SAM-dependent methyltransferase, partial [Bacteroidetes bacterium]|nr:class I SAM-dependent methyltransferase [Bacteroidota bacterium]